MERQMILGIAVALVAAAPASTASDPVVCRTFDQPSGALTSQKVRICKKQSEWQNEEASRARRNDLNQARFRSTGR
jgi:hypothetical protein